MSNAEYLAFATELARAAGKIMKTASRTKFKVSHKEDDTPVSEIDEQINQFVITQVQQKFPAHGVLGEEASYNTESDMLWICDPIDGTAAFITHTPTSTFMLALIAKGRPVVAVVYNPWTDVLYHAVQGQGAWFNGERLQVSNRDGSALALVGGSGCSTVKSFIDNPLGVQLLQERSWHTVNLHGIGQKGMMVVDGGIDGVFYSHDGAHDVAALDLLITEAGGKATTFAGEPLTYDNTGKISGAILSNGLIHDELKIIADAIIAERM